MSSWQRGDNRSLENGDGAANRQANSLSVLMRESAVPKRLVGVGSVRRPDSWSYIKTHKRATHVDTQEKHKHTGAWSRRRAKSDSVTAWVTGQP